MSSNEHTHTPGRLTVARDFEGDRDVAMAVVGYDGEHVYLIAESDVPFASQSENVRRLAACWNCLADLPTDLIEMIAALDKCERFCALANVADAVSSVFDRDFATDEEGDAYEKSAGVTAMPIVARCAEFVESIKAPAAPANTLPMSESLDGDVRMAPVKLDAAPLMKALRKIEQLCFEYEGDAKWTWHDLYAETVRIARAAIAKAEGK